MFKNILIPISSEYYSKEVLERSVFLAEKFNSTINLVYIIEEKMLDQTDRRSDAYRTYHERKETKKGIIRDYVRAAGNIVFNDANLYFKDKGVSLEEKVVEGEFSNIVKNELLKKDYNLILMGFEKECMLNYRLLDDVNIPIWIESGIGNKSILAVCSNLAPNQKVPQISIELAESLGWQLHMLYVVDVEDTVEVDETGKRSSRKSEEDLTSKGQKFVQEMKEKGINASLVIGSLEKATVKAADSIGANLVIVGREQKKKGMLGLPAKHVKRKLAEKCNYSILFIN